MEWKQQFEIFNKLFPATPFEQGLKSTIKNAAEYLGIPSHKYQAWKDGQRPVTEDLRMLAQEFEFRAEWLLLGIGELNSAALNHPFDPKYVETATHSMSWSVAYQIDCPKLLKWEDDHNRSL